MVTLRIINQTGEIIATTTYSDQTVDGLKELVRTALNSGGALILNCNDTTGATRIVIVPAKLLETCLIEIEENET